jgi:hypothetical protein
MKRNRTLTNIGFYGGFTTFSTFSLDAYYLMQRGESWAAAARVIGSVILPLARVDCRDAGGSGSSKLGHCCFQIRPPKPASTRQWQSA